MFVEHPWKKCFAEMIKQVVSDAAIQDTAENLLDPPGRKPAEALVTRSKWFHSLSEHDRGMVREVIAEGVHEAVFGFLCVLVASGHYRNKARRTNTG